MKPSAIRDMRRLYDMRDILHMNSRRRVVVCPLPTHIHHNNTPSFSIFTSNDGIQKFRCHGASCGKEGDVIDLTGYLAMGNAYDPKDGEKVKEALAILSGGTRINPPKPQTTKKPELNNGLHKQYLPVGNEVLAYAQRRGLTAETLDRFMVGQRETPSATWMTLPTIEGERLRGVKMRNIHAVDKRRRFAQIPGSVDGLFNYNAVTGSREPVLIVKGEITAMLLTQHGFVACAPTGGEGAYYSHDRFARVLAFSSKRVVVGDNDPDPGVREKIMAATQRRAQIFKAEVRLPPEQYKDVDLWLLAEPDIAIPTIRQWISR